MNLYEMMQEYNDLSRELNEFAEINEGEIPETLSDRLDLIQSDIKSKAENIGVWVKNLISEAEAIRAEEKRLAERRNRAENLSERLKLYLSLALPEGFKLSLPRIEIGWRKSISVNVFDPSLIPENLCKITIEPSKTMIRKAFKKGESVPGAKIEEKSNIQIK